MALCFIELRVGGAPTKNETATQPSRKRLLPGAKSCPRAVAVIKYWAVARPVPESSAAAPIASRIAYEQ